MCTRCRGEPFSCRILLALSDKCKTCEKEGASQKCLEAKNNQNSGKYDKQKNFREENKIPQS